MAHRLFGGPFADAVWSSTGALAVVRGGYVWAGNAAFRKRAVGALAVVRGGL